MLFDFKNLWSNSAFCGLSRYFSVRRKIALLSANCDVRRAAGYLCYRPGTSGKISSRAPHLALTKDRLVYHGPPAIDCGCPGNRASLHGLTEQGDFVSTQSNTLGTVSCCTTSLFSGTALFLGCGADISQFVAESLCGWDHSSIVEISCVRF